MAERKPDLRLTGEVVPAELTREGIREISTELAKQIARETEQAIAAGQGDSALYLRIGHSRTHSRTGDHRNTIHGKWGGGGEADLPG